MVPELTARMARASNPRGTTAMWVRDHLDGLWSDQDFVSWYPRDGRPGLSPAQLAMVCVLQFLLNLSDRQAAEAVRCRIDFKYALALELDDPGFHHSVLSDFRDRLGEDDRADRLLSLALERMRKAGLVTERGRQRTDSTQVLAAARDSTRLEMVLEAVRAALEEAARDVPEILDGLVDADRATRYGRLVRLPSQPTHPVTRLKQAGADAHRLLACLPSHRRGPRMEALRQILVQNFLVDARGVLRPRTEKDGQPKGARRVSPYDCQTRRAIRGNTRWSGYLVHVTETCDSDENANLITDIATTSPIRDTQALPGIHTRLRQRRLLPREHLVDGGYLSVALLESSAVHHQIQLVGPVKASGAWQRKEQSGFTRDDFTIDFDRRHVICPNGQITKTWITPPAMAPCTVARFHPQQCNPCPDRSSCTRGTSARTVNFLPRHLHELQIRNRTEQQDLQRRRLYSIRSGIEGTICEFVNGHQARRSRYHGLRKTHIQHVLTGIAINLERLASRTPPRRQGPRHPTVFQSYLDSRGLTWECWWRQGK
ncbi:IS1182 family transposase [Streptomyces sp. NPDC001443]